MSISIEYRNYILKTAFPVTLNLLSGFAHWLSDQNWSELPTQNRVTFRCKNALLLPNGSERTQDVATRVASDTWTLHRHQVCVLFKLLKILFIFNKLQVNFLINTYKDEGRWWEVYSLVENFK